MTVCLMCLEDCSSKDEGIEIFSDVGTDLNISTIISKYFWFAPQQYEESAQCVCIHCWKIIHQFHQLYERVAQAHCNLKGRLPHVLGASDKDPLPVNDQRKCSNDGNPETLMGDGFFDSEVKVEVNDLDLLPQVEIIEGVVARASPNSTEWTERTSRRRRRTREGVTSSSSMSPSPLGKMIKREDSLLSTTEVGDGHETESELPLDMLLRGGAKTEVNYNESETSRKSDTATDVALKAAYNPLEKKRRGRPKKLKESQSEDPKSDQGRIEPATKAAEAVEEDDELLLDLPYGTNDSDASSGSTDSDDSMPDFQPEEQYAKIPKRVVLKPKKYRKRPKRLVPQRRMTREEINRKKSQQVEYDKVIAQFFDKFSCPKCNLLVKNFGEMCQHFRMSHNCDPGYMMCCGRKFHQRKTLAEHVYVHWNPEHFKCTACGRVFQDARGLEVHEQTHTNPPEPKDKKVFQCDKCPKTFTTKAAFEYHSFSKHVPKSEFKFTCPECNKKLPTERKLKDHMKYMHDPESAIICDKCGKQVRSQSNLKKHHQIEHSDVPRPAPVPMQCEICGTWLRHLAGLKQHMKTIHEDSGGEHRCPICNKTSTNARALKRHIYHNHECERKFKCTMCEKAFKRPQDLREHTSTHTGEVLYTCPNCPMTFFSNANMYKHRQRLHRAEWEADKKKPVPPNIMQQAVGATAAMKMQQAVGATSAFFASKQGAQQIQIESSVV